MLLLWEQHLNAIPEGDESASRLRSTANAAGKAAWSKKTRHLALSVTRFTSRVHILLLIFIFPMKLAMLPPHCWTNPFSVPILGSVV